LLIHFITAAKKQKLDNKEEKIALKSAQIIRDIILKSLAGVKSRIFGVEDESDDEEEDLDGCTFGEEI
jgi:hypothetical protein